jgi:hypothetical protein
MDKIAIEFDKSEAEQLDIILDLAVKQLGRRFVAEILDIEGAIKDGQFTKMQVANLQYCLDVALTRCGKSVGFICLMLDRKISAAVAAAMERAA